MQEYNASSMAVLQGLEAVRVRPGMYIGNTETEGLHHLIYEIVDNAVDEALQGFGDKIEVILHKDNSVTIIDYGRGIPVDLNKKAKMTGVDIAFMVLHGGAKFNTDSGYKVSGGLHGVGAAVVNALSEYTNVCVKRDGFIHTSKYSRGKIVQKLAKTDKIKRKKDCGTTVNFRPDPLIFGEKQFDRNIIRERLQNTAKLTKGLKIIFKDENCDLTEEFFFKEGILAFINEKLESCTSLLNGKPFYFQDVTDNVEVEIAFTYVEDSKCNIKAFTNNIYNDTGGTHEQGFKNAISREITNYITSKNLNKKGSMPTSDDIRDGLFAIINVKVQNPQFLGQTKNKLNNPEVVGAVSSLTAKHFKEYLAKYEADVRRIANNAIEVKTVREEAKSLKDMTKRKSLLETNLCLPGKLSDCSLSENKITELFLVEGDSAGGSAKMGRNRVFQAILPLKGKILNIEKADLKKISEHEEIQAIMNSINTGILDNFDENKRRYNKIIIMTDADVDGSHIRVLLLTFFYRFMRQLIELGYVYAAMPPLYKVSVSDRKNTQMYLYSEKELSDYLAKIDGKYRYIVQRYKGLGEMNPEQLWETTMDPQKRRLKRFNISDAMMADMIFSELMGKDTEARKKHISESVRFASKDL